VALEPLLAFVVTSAVVLVTPDPTILTVISYSATHGDCANGALVAGVALSNSTALVASLLGLGALLATAAFWFTVVKWIVGLYLLYLGIKRSARACGFRPPGRGADAALASMAVREYLRSHRAQSKEHETRAETASHAEDHRPGEYARTLGC